MKEILITSSALILALLILRLLFAKRVRPTLMYAAWALVALRLLIPVQIGEMNFSVLTAAKPLTETVTEFEGLRVIGQNEREAEVQVIGDYIQQDQTVFTPEVQEYIQESLERNETTEEIATAISKTQSLQNTFVPEVQQQVAQQLAEQTRFVSLGQAATAVWLAGVAVMAVWFVAVNLRFSRKLCEQRQKLEVDSPIPVYVSELVDSPCLVGLFRPTIYLTPECGEKEESHRHVLTHELTHYAHKDHIWALVRCVCLCVYWFDPLVWIAARCSRRDCELTCDQGALKRLGEEERIAYGKTLLEVVSHASASSKLMQTATAMNETKEQLKERVEFIVKKPKWSLIAAIAMVLICAIVTGCTATGSTRTQTTEPTGTQATEPKKRWEISEEEQLRIKRDYVAFWGFDDATEDVQLMIVSPVDEGYALFIGLQDSFNMRDSWTELVFDSVNGLKFYMPRGWMLDFYNGTQFRTLQEAFNLGWVNEAELQAIWEDYYAQFPKAWEQWQTMHPGGEFTEDEQASVHALFEIRNYTWYSMATSFVFDDPTKLDLGLLFYNGTGTATSWEKITSEEKEFLLQNGFNENLDIQKMEIGALEVVLNQYFGVSLEDVQIPENWVYYASADAYYTNNNGAMVAEDFKIRAIEKLGDGEYSVWYFTNVPVYNPVLEMNVKTERVMYLQKQPDGTYQIKSNMFIY